MGAITNLIGKFLSASYSLADIIDKLKSFALGVLANENVAPIWGMVKGAFESFRPYLVYMFLALFVVVALFGKKLLPLIRFAAFFVVGFALGVYFLTPYVHVVLPTLPAVAVGAVTGVVAALISKLLYLLCLVGVVGYDTYYICYIAMIPFLETVTKGSTKLSLLAAAGVVVLVLLLRKYFEMLVLSLAGAWGIVTIVKRFYDFTALSVFDGYEMIVNLAAIAVVGVVCFIFQFKTRRRY